MHNTIHLVHIQPVEQDLFTSARLVQCLVPQRVADKLLQFLTTWHSCVSCGSQHVLGQSELCAVLAVTERTPLSHDLARTIEHKVTLRVTVRAECLAGTGLHSDGVGLCGTAVAHHRAVHGSERCRQRYTCIEQRDCGGIDARRQQLASQLALCIYRCWYIRTDAPPSFKIWMTMLIWVRGWRANNIWLLKALRMNCCKNCK